MAARKLWIKFLLFYLFYFGIIDFAKAQFNFHLPLKNDMHSINHDLFFIGGSAELTAGSIDPDNEGWLRLTPDRKDQTGWACVDQSFTSTLGLLVEFEYKTWSRGGEGTQGLADGISVFLYNGDTDRGLFRAGANGEALMYGKRRGTDYGLSNAYLGIGMDEFGNFSSGEELEGGGPGKRSNSIVIRGGSPNYTYINGAALPGRTTVGYLTNTPSRPTDDQFYRKVRFYLLPAQTLGGFQITVQLKTKANDPFVTLIDKQIMPQVPPELLKIGFGASTGGGWANHEIRHLTISTPIDLAVSNSVNKLVAKSNGEQLSYTTVISNPGINAVTGSNKATLTIETSNLSDLTPPQDISSNVVKSFDGITIEYKHSESTLDKQVYEISNLPVGGQLTLTYSGKTRRNTSFVMSKASINTLDDVEPSNDISSTTTTVIRQVDLKVNTQVERVPGTDKGVKYTTVISNLGPDDNITTMPSSAILKLKMQGLVLPTDITLQSLVKSHLGTQLTKSTNPNRSSPSEQEYRLINFPKGAMITLTYTAEISSGVKSISNETEIKANPVSFEELALNDNTSVITNALIDLSVKNQVDRVKARVGTMVNYTITLNNQDMNPISGLNEAICSIETSGLRDFNLLSPVTKSDADIQIVRTEHTLHKQIFKISNLPAGGRIVLKYTARVERNDSFVFASTLLL